MSEADQEIYKDFSIVISEKWQTEIIGKLFVKLDKHF